MAFINQIIFGSVSKSVVFFHFQRIYFGCGVWSDCFLLAFGVLNAFDHVNYSSLTTHRYSALRLINFNPRHIRYYYFYTFFYLLVASVAINGKDLLKFVIINLITFSITMKTSTHAFKRTLFYTQSFTFKFVVLPILMR